MGIIWARAAFFYSFEKKTQCFFPSTWQENSQFKEFGCSFPQNSKQNILPVAPI
jgi:hypothetical protein